MTKLYNLMIHFFEKDNWYYESFEDMHALRLPFKGKSMEWPCIARVQEDKRLFLFYSVCPVNVPSERRLALAEFMTLANYDMPIGNFEMDFADGEIRFKTSVGLGQLDWSDELIKVAVHTNVFSMDQYLPGILQVIEGTLSPQEAVEFAELT